MNVSQHYTGKANILLGLPLEYLNVLPDEMVFF